MTTINLDATDALAVFDFRRDHSPLWHWMKANHDALIERAGGDRMPWIELCEVFARQELFNRAGKAPTPACAKLTWHRLRAYVARANERLEKLQREREEAQDQRRAEREARREASLAEARLAAAREERLHPRKLPASWYPPVVRHAPVSAATPPVADSPPELRLPRRQEYNSQGGPLEQRIVVEGEALAHPEDIAGLPSRVGYHSVNQWFRDAAAIIRRKQPIDRSAKERSVLVEAQMIGNRF